MNTPDTVFGTSSEPGSSTLRRNFDQTEGFGTLAGVASFNGGLPFYTPEIDKKNGSVGGKVEENLSANSNTKPTKS